MVPPHFRAGPAPLPSSTPALPLAPVTNRRDARVDHDRERDRDRPTAPGAVSTDKYTIMFTGGFVVSYVRQDTQQNLPRTDQSEQFPHEALEDWTWSGDTVDQLAIELWDKYGREHALVLIKTEPDPADAKKVIYSKDTDIKLGEKLASFITVHNGASWCKFLCNRGVVTLSKGPVLTEKMLHTMVNKDCMVCVMWFGPHIESVKTYKAMLMQLYLPLPTCHSGFAMEATNQSVMAALKRKHGATYGDCEAGYQLWAADLLRATNNHTLTEDMINQAPMDGVL
ncbi:hypothetical protein GGF32_005908 [Allomyces javanicus]|nr:hypothetical protein GGF32_005908 [Allomyces javanicus]